MDPSLLARALVLTLSTPAILDLDPSLLVQGLLLGFSIAAVVGPIALLCLRRTLSSGFPVGFVSGLGAATADATYGAVAAFGISAVANALVDQRLWFRLIGGLFLLILAVRTLRAHPARTPAPTGDDDTDGPSPRGARAASYGPGQASSVKSEHASPGFHAPVSSAQPARSLSDMATMGSSAEPARSLSDMATVGSSAEPARSLSDTATVGSSAEPARSLSDTATVGSSAETGRSMSAGAAPSRRTTHAGGGSRRSLELAAAYTSTLALTLSNPMTILSFGAIFAGLGLGSGAATSPAHAAALVVGVFVGSATWWLVLAILASRLRTRFTPQRMRQVNIASGLLILAFAVQSLASAALPA